MTRPTVERRQRLPKLPHTKFVAIFFEMRLRDFIHVLLPVPIKIPFSLSQLNLNAGSDSLRMPCSRSSFRCSTRFGKAVEHGEGDRGNREEIHRRDGFPMVTQKSEPTLGWVWISGGS